MKYLPLIWSGMWRKRGRAILVVLQVAIAFTLFGLLQGMQSGLAAVIEKMDANVFIVSRATGDAPLPIAHYGRLRAMDDLVNIQRQSFLFGTYQKPDQTLFAVATDVPVLIADATTISLEPTSALSAMQQTRDGILVGSKLAAKYHWKVGDRIPLQSSELQQNGSRVWTLQVVGVMHDSATFSYENVLVINWEYLNEARAEHRDSVGRYIVRIRDLKQALAVAQRIDKLFANSPDETRTESLAESAQNSLQSVGDLNFIVRTIVGAVMFALLLSITAMMMQSTRERAPELAVLRTLGFSDQRVFWMLIFELMVLCMAAATLGLLLAARILPLAERQLSVPITMPWSVFLIGLVIALVMAVVSAAPPAWRCLRMQVAEALAGR